MDENNEILMHIYKTSEMGVLATEKLLNTLKTKENKIKPILESELKEYEKYYKMSGKILNHNSITPIGNSIITKISSDMGIKMETIKDNSDSAIASMLIEGFTMGMTEMNIKIDKYINVCDRKTMKIAKKLMKFQEEEIERLKTYL